MNDTQLLLLAAKTLISYPEDREPSLFAYARTRSGKRVSNSTHQDAVCWCAFGSVFAVAADEKLPPWVALDALHKAAWELFEQHPAIVNAKRPHKDVMTMFDCAIELSV